MLITKNYNRQAPTFANINLLGKCNASCFFCLGGDLGSRITTKESTLGSSRHFKEWKNFHTFLHYCMDAGIKKLYVTGQNMDGLQYPYLFDLIETLQSMEYGFNVGIRTNSLLALRKHKEIFACKEEIGYTINSLDVECNIATMGPNASKLTRDHFDKVLDIKECRVSTVVHHKNIAHIPELIKYVTSKPNVKYLQLRRVSTDHRFPSFQQDVDIFENLAKEMGQEYHQEKDFYGAPVYLINGKQVVLWRTVETTINSYNYFTDGTVSKEYFVVEGYEKNVNK